MTPPNPSLTRVEKKLDELGAGMTSILERLASIEATSKAEASERATVHSYTQSALAALSDRLDKEERAREASESARLAAQRWAIGLALMGLLFPLILGLIWALAAGGFGK